MAGKAADKGIHGALATARDGGSGVIDHCERFFDSIGMMRSSSAPIFRAAFGFGAVWLVLNAVKPSVFYEENGQPRPWSLYDSQNPDAVMVPWFGPAAAAAFVCSM